MKKDGLFKISTETMGPVTLSVWAEKIWRDEEMVLGPDDAVSQQYWIEVLDEQGRAAHEIFSELPSALRRRDEIRAEIREVMVA